jgi:putative transposase
MQQTQTKLNKHNNIINKFMKINKAYKVELNPNNKQKTLLEKSCSVTRFVYNWGLEQRIKLYNEEKKSLSYYDQDKILNSIKETEFPWMYEVGSVCCQKSLRDLDTSFKNFYRRLKQCHKKVGFPKFKSKHKSNFSFSFYGFKIKNNSIKIPKIGYVRLKYVDYIPSNDVKYNALTVSKDVDRWFISVQVEEEIPDIVQETELDVVGIDLGIKTLATCSDGVIFDNPKYLKNYEKRLKFRQRMHSKKLKGSKNCKKSKLKLQKVYRKIRNCRKDYVHKMTTSLVRTKPRILVLENLNVSGMMKNHKLAKSISDSSFYEIKRQLKYKSSWYGGTVIQVDTFFPSSKLCSNCGYKDTELTLKDRVYTCPECGLVLDRDLNASYNLRKEGLRICTESSSGN